MRDNDHKNYHSHNVAQHLGLRLREEEFNSASEILSQVTCQRRYFIEGLFFPLSNQLKMRTARNHYLRAKGGLSCRQLQSMSKSEVETDFPFLSRINPHFEAPSITTWSIGGLPLSPSGGFLSPYFLHSWTLLNEDIRSMQTYL